MHYACDHVTIPYTSVSVDAAGYRSKGFPTRSVNEDENVLIELLKHVPPALKEEIMNYRQKIFEAQEKARKEKQDSEERERVSEREREWERQRERDKKNPFKSEFWSD